MMRNYSCKYHLLEFHFRVYCDSYKWSNTYFHPIEQPNRIGTRCSSLYLSGLLLDLKTIVVKLLLLMFTFNDVCIFRFQHSWLELQLFTREASKISGSSPHWEWEINDVVVCVSTQIVRAFVCLYSNSFAHKRTCECICVYLRKYLPICIYVRLYASTYVHLCMRAVCMHAYFSMPTCLLHLALPTWESLKQQFRELMINYSVQA